MEVQFKLKLKNLNFQSLPWIVKNWEVQNLTRNWEKCFLSRKIEFWTHWKFCTYISWKLLPEKKCLSYLKMLIMQISTQTDNQKYRKSTLFKQIGMKFWSPKINILCKTAFISFIKCQTVGLWRSIRKFWNK